MSPGAWEDPDRVEVLLEAWEERAALLEYDGDQSRAEAEREATRLVFGQPTLPPAVEALRRELAARAAAEVKKKKKKKKKTKKR